MADFKKLDSQFKKHFLGKNGLNRFGYSQQNSAYQELVSNKKPHPPSHRVPIRPGDKSEKSKYAISSISSLNMAPTKSSKKQPGSKIEKSKLTDKNSVTVNQSKLDGDSIDYLTQSMDLHNL